MFHRTQARSLYLINFDSKVFSFSILFFFQTNSPPMFNLSPKAPFLLTLIWYAYDHSQNSYLCQQSHQTSVFLVLSILLILVACLQHPMKNTIEARDCCVALATGLADQWGEGEMNWALWCFAMMHKQSLEKDVLGDLTFFLSSVSVIFYHVCFTVILIQHLISHSSFSMNSSQYNHFNLHAAEHILPHNEIMWRKFYFWASIQWEALEGLWKAAFLQHQHEEKNVTGVYWNCK